jgi:hypothetical protein
MMLAGKRTFPQACRRAYARYKSRSRADQYFLDPAGRENQHYCVQLPYHTVLGILSMSVQA